MTNPAYRIETSRLVLRCWSPSDAPLLEAAVTESLDHLRPWMQWAHNEPEPIESRVERLRRYRASFDLGRDFVYGILNPAETAVLGGSGLHTRAGPSALEIGYWIHVDHVGKGYASEASAALTRVGFEVHEVRRIEIHCDPDNATSAVIPERLGFTHEATLKDHGIGATGEPRDAMLWTMVRTKYPASPPATAEVAAFDALGHRLI